MDSEKKTQTYEFSSDMSNLMSIIINAFYSSKDVAIRELISNSSDALEKIRYRSLTDSDVLSDNSELLIKVIPDKENKQVLIEDSGIGMDEEDMKNFLGIVAKSGTKEFLKNLENNKGADLKGQFGMGVYSSLLISDNVSFVSKKHGCEPCKFDTDGSGTYSITNLSSDECDIKRGTRITLNIKEGCEEFLEENRLKDIVKKHSSFTLFPIQLQVIKEEEVTDDEASPEDDDVDDDDTPKVEEVDEEEEKKEKKTKKVQTKEWETLNEDKPIWTKKSDEITEEEHKKFYKKISGDYDEFATYKSFDVEGSGLEFTGMVYCPKQRPFDFGGGSTKDKKNVKVYSRGVFITDDSHDICPEYFSFVKGVISCDDLPLNVSRETIQGQSRVLKIFQKTLVKKVIEMFKDLQEDEEKYKKFYSSFSKELKLGVYEDSKNREKLASLLRFTSAKNDEEISFDTYIENMKEDQKEIYYISGESIDAVKSSPFIEKVKKNGRDVLFMVDTIDEYMLQQFSEYKEKKLVNCSKENLDLGEEKNEDQEKEFKDVCDFVKETLKDNVEKVKVSKRLVDTPCILVTGDFGWTANMERIMKAQAMSGGEQNNYMISKKTLEINPDHKIIKSIKSKFEKDKTDKTLKDLVWLLHDTSLIDSGFTLKEPVKFTSRIRKIISIGLDLDSDDEDDEHIPVEKVDDVAESKDDVTLEDITEDSIEESMESVD
jgi:molecular chaperone HtpG